MKKCRLMSSTAFIREMTLSKVQVGTFYLQNHHRRLGGNISVTSEVGKGTTFTFVLPLESTSKTEAEKKEEDNQETTAETHSTEQRGKNAAPGDSPRMKRSEHSTSSRPS